MRTVNYPAMESGDMSGSLTTAPTPLTSIALISFQCSWTGAPVGTIKLQASNDAVIFTDVSNSSAVVNGAGDVLYNLAEIGYLYLRVVYTRTSGTGALKIIVNGKGV